ncbi:unnamed protein product, partial [Closterium sp. Naga37s-1]
EEARAMDSFKGGSKGATAVAAAAKRRGSLRHRKVAADVVAVMLDEGMRKRCTHPPTQAAAAQLEALESDYTGAAAARLEALESDYSGVDAAVDEDDDVFNAEEELVQEASEPSGQEVNEAVIPFPPIPVRSIPRTRSLECPPGFTPAKRVSRPGKRLRTSQASEPSGQEVNEAVIPFPPIPVRSIPRTRSLECPPGFAPAKRVSRPGKRLRTSQASEPSGQEVNEAVIPFPPIPVRSIPLTCSLECPPGFAPAKRVSRPGKRLLTSQASEPSGQEVNEAVIPFPPIPVRSIPRTRSLECPPGFAPAKRVSRPGKRRTRQAAAAVVSRASKRTPKTFAELLEESSLAALYLPLGHTPLSSTPHHPLSPSASLEALPPGTPSYFTAAVEPGCCLCVLSVCSPLPCFSLASMPPPHSPQANLEILPLGTPSYLTAAVGPPTAASVRRFCSACGSHAPYTCPRCAARFCCISCQRLHNETRCLKFVM